MKKITNNQYSDMVDQKTPGSSLLVKSLKAFVTGGAICFIAEIIFNFLISLGIKEVNVATFTPMIMVFLGALLTGLDLYNKIAK